MNKKINCICSLLCIGCLCISSVFTSAAAENQGKKGTFFGFTFLDRYANNANIIKPANVRLSDIEKFGYDTFAALTKEKTDAMPAGRRAIDINYTTSDLLSVSDNYLWFDEGIAKVKSVITQFFETYSAIGGKADYIIDDNESTATVYGFENAAIANFQEDGETVTESIEKHGHLYEDYIKEMLIQVEEDPRYETDIKPLLEERGFVFGEDYDLKYLNLFPTAVGVRQQRFYESDPPQGAENAYLVFNDVMEIRTRQAYKEAVFDPIRAIYPEIKTSNYGYVTKSGKTPVVEFNGNSTLLYDSSIPLISGTHSSPVLYGKYNNIRTKKPEGYPFEIFKKTSFNILLMEMKQYQDVLLSDDTGGIMPWITMRTWSDDFIGGKYYNYNDTDYHYEMIFHVALGNPDPFLIFNNGSTANTVEEDTKQLEETFYYLDSILGYDDREPIVPSVDNAIAYDQRYLLSGMYAGGKNVWRITPDLFTPGMSLEKFLYDAQQMIFKIGNQVIDFPEGSYIDRTSGDPSEYGYWVISPAGTFPKEYRIDDETPPAEPVETYDGLPTGYLYPEQEGEAAPRWSDEFMKELIRRGSIVGSVTDTEAEKEITKAEFLAMLLGAFNLKPTAYKNQYDDVNSSHWFSGTIARAAELGWISTTGRNISPENNLTRMEMIEIFMKAVSASESDTAVQPISFQDENAIANPEIVSKAVALGYISGYPDQYFYPHKIATREQAAKLIWTYLNQAQ